MRRESGCGWREVVLRRQDQGGPGVQPKSTGNHPGKTCPSRVTWSGFLRLAELWIDNLICEAGAVTVPYG